MNKARQVLLGSIGVVMVGIAAGEHLYRRVIERRYHQMVESRRQLELQFGEVVATHERLQHDLTQAQQRSQELAQALTEARAQLEDAVGRLTQETRSGHELQGRLSAVQQQMEQLQGELSVTLQRHSAAPSSAAAPSAVQLERVVVSDAGASDLSGRIVSIHTDWNFVVIDLGWDAVRIGDTVSIVRNGQLLAKARVDRVQEGVSAATLLPDWETAEVHVNDLVRVL